MSRLLGDLSAAAIIHARKAAETQVILAVEEIGPHGAAVVLTHLAAHFIEAAALAMRAGMLKQELNRPLTPADFPSAGSYDDDVLLLALLTVTLTQVKEGSLSQAGGRQQLRDWFKAVRGHEHTSMPDWL